MLKIVPQQLHAYGRTESSRIATVLVLLSALTGMLMVVDILYIIARAAFPVNGYGLQTPASIFFSLAIAMILLFLAAVITDHFESTA